MTAYIVVRWRGLEKQFWTGRPDGWTPNRHDARTFEFMTDATMRAYLECHAEPDEWFVEAILMAERVAS